MSKRNQNGMNAPEDRQEAAKSAGIPCLEMMQQCCSGEQGEGPSGFFKFMQKIFGRWCPCHSQEEPSAGETH